MKTNKMEKPLVSCIMPTYNRREFVPHAIHYFLCQDYPNKELIIIDDGTDIIEDLVPNDERIRYFRLKQKITLGAKLNLACEHAQGTIIAHWDDDDWYAPRRLTYQIETLINEGIDICGINNLLYFDMHRNRAFQYIYPPNQRKWLLGSTLCYKKNIWTNIRFADIDVGMDGLFVWAVPPHRVTVLQDSTFSVFMIHKHNVSPKITDGAWWHSYSVEKIQQLLDSDWTFYKTDHTVNTYSPRPRNAISEHHVKKSVKPIRNIFACLVHESQECIVDLVRNLKYLDPSSQVLIYNGGTDKDLFKNFPYEQYGVVIVPEPRTLKWGYLHDFALDCMRYSIDNLSFDILTIVDSDQLCIGRNYSDYMAKYLNNESDIGMFGITEKRHTSNTKVKPAITAYKELGLWQHFLKQFPDGINKFVYWTFWPSTVFTKNAAIDLVKLFENNQQLKEIFKKTKIWASEEIILPTLVSLLGYKIKKNPCSYNYMKYRVKYSLENIRSALNLPDVFWVHPVAREINNELRKYVSKHFDFYKRAPRYRKEVKIDSQGKNSSYIFTLPIVRQIKNVEGWLDDDEAELLIHATQDILKSKARDTAVVEIGSYCGKSSIVLGGIVKELCNTSSRVYAIDLFDGKVGAADQTIEQKPPTYNKFMENIIQAGLKDFVFPLISKSYDVENWKAPIGFLYIDGLHDYTNVARDFYHFEKWVVPGGYIAFHDYADSFPGVKTFVDELLSSGKYRKVSCIKSMIIIEKIFKDNSTGKEVNPTGCSTLKKKQNFSVERKINQSKRWNSKKKLKLAKLILHYNTQDLTSELCKSVRDAIIIDNGSDKSLSTSIGNHVIRFDKNYGFTVGWNKAIKLLFNEYDAFWLMNSDIIIQQDVIERIEDLLEYNGNIPVITPSFNSWLEFLRNKETGGIREVPFIELTAAVIRKKVFETVGFFDERFSIGYGVDFDFGYRLRKAELNMFVDDGSEFYHKGQQTIKLHVGTKDFLKRAIAELNEGLTTKYGENWRDVIFEGTGFICPVFS